MILRPDNMPDIPPTLVVTYEVDRFFLNVVSCTKGIIWLTDRSFNSYSQPLFPKFYITDHIDFWVVVLDAFMEYSLDVTSRKLFKVHHGRNK